MARLQISQDVAFEVVEDEAVLLHFPSGEYFTLNPSGTRIWQLIEEHGDLDAVRQKMLDEFEVGADQLDSDIGALVDELREKGFLMEGEPAERDA